MSTKAKKEASYATIKQMKKIIVGFLGVILLTYSVNVASHFLVPNRTSFELPPGVSVPLRQVFVPWLNFDGRHYLEITLHGYQNPDRTLAFFPLYPLVVHILSLGGIINPIIVGLLVSMASALAAVVVFYKLATQEFSSKIAKKALILLMVFPSFFYFFSFYAESLFFLLTVTTFWFIYKKQMWWAAGMAALASATRPIGLALIPVFLYLGWTQYRKTSQIPWYVIVAPLGFLFYTFHVFTKFGNPLLLLSAQTDTSFGRSFTLLNPLNAFYQSTLRVVSGPQFSYDNFFVYPVIVFELMIGIMGILFLIFAYKKIPLHYYIYVLFSQLIMLSSGVLSANIRQFLVLFPIYIYLAMILHGKWFKLWFAVSLLLLILCSTIFLRGYWIA